MSDDPKTNNWDSIRTSDDFQLTLEFGNMDGAMEQFGSLTLKDLPRYLTDQRPNSTDR